MIIFFFFRRGLNIIMADDSERNRAFAAAQTFASAIAELVVPKT